MARNQLPGAHVIDIDDDLRAFSERKTYGKQSRLDQIHKIHLKDKKDYEPSHLSIGPYYHGCPELHTMENVKWGYLSNFLELDHEMNLHDYIKAVGKLEKQARSFYVEEIKMDRKSFVEMLLLDACFILMTLNGTDGIGKDFKTSVEGAEIKMDDNYKDQLVIDVDENNQTIERNECHANGEGDNSYDIHDCFRTKILLRDVLLLENQIPFFVIIKIYEIVTRGRSPIPLLVNNIVQSMKYIFDCHPEEIQMSNPAKEIYHLLHLCQMYFKPRPRDQEEKCENHVTRSLPHKSFIHLGNEVLEGSKQNLSRDYEYETLIVRRVTLYHEARIHLKKRGFFSDTPYSLLDIQFVNGTLEIPCLNIDPEIFTLLKNLITLEQICPQSGNYFTSYILFWSKFITTPDDVALVIEKEIIRHNFDRDTDVLDQIRSLANCNVFD